MSVFTTTSQFYPILSDVCCFHTATSEDRSDPAIPFHEHDAYEIYIFICGDIQFYVEHACYQLSQGDMVIINPNELHHAACYNTQIYERVCFNIKQSALERLSSGKTNFAEHFSTLSTGVKGAGEKKIVRLNNEQIKDFIRLNEYINRFIQSDEFAADILLDSFLSQLFAYIIHLYKYSSYSPANMTPDLIHATMLYIKEHLGERLLLEDMSKKFYMSGAHISREFKKHTGLTIRAYILNKRISKAKALLHEGKSVAEACYMSGFSDYSNFIRSFTNNVGVAPGKYKKNLYLLSGR